MEMYNVKDIISIMNCSQDKAYKIIRGLNQKLVNDGVPKESIVSGKISKKYFHETLKISIWEFHKKRVLF